MPATMFTEGELFTIENALRVASEQYRKDAVANSANNRIHAAFTQQADECDALIERLEAI